MMDFNKVIKSFLILLGTEALFYGMIILSVIPLALAPDPSEPGYGVFAGISAILMLGSLIGGTILGFWIWWRFYSKWVGEWKAANAYGEQSDGTSHPPKEASDDPAEPGAEAVQVFQTDPIDKPAIVDAEPKEEMPEPPDIGTMDKNQLAKYAREMIDSDTGDTGRLEHIIRMLEAGRELYKSDEGYLQSAIKRHLEV